MPGNNSRQSVAARRLRSKLRKNRGSLADDFEFKMFVVVNFKNEPANNRTVFEVEQVHALMTNDYAHRIMEKANKKEFSVESSVELLNQDMVQLHARRWHSRRRDVIGCSDNIDFMIWPRNDLLSIKCHLFSRWKHETSAPFRPCAAEFTVHKEEYEAQLGLNDDVDSQSSTVVTNTDQSMFMFISRHNIDSARGLTAIFRVHSLCISLPQADLLNWNRGTMMEVMKPILETI